ncbi:MAG TPA: tryptophan 2,3-dioxygenase family protein [Candidatus Angelobacter sp.]
MVTTYWDYLKLDQLLNLQNGLDKNESQLLPDELHFIIVHQIFELWFKLILSELRLVRDALLNQDSPEIPIPGVLRRLDRINRTLSSAAQQWEVMETISPQEFLAFRDKLFPASGFQSFQFPEMEILLGLEEALLATTSNTRSLDHIRLMASQSEAGAHAWSRIENARKEKTLRSALYEWLERWPIPKLSAQNVTNSINVDHFLESYLGAIRTYYAAQERQLMQAPDSSRAELEARFAASYREAEEFVLAMDSPESHRQRIRRIRAAIFYIETYDHRPALNWARMVISSVLDLESALLLWRTRHARVAERVIGRRVGTGGGSVSYLDQTLGLRIFTDFWAARTHVLPHHFAPPIEPKGQA